MGVAGYVLDARKLDRAAGVAGERRRSPWRHLHRLNDATRHAVTTYWPLMLLAFVAVIGVVVIAIAVWPEPGEPFTP